MSSGTPLYQNLDTTFVNLWSLLRKLTQQGFIGRVHVELKDYSAEVFLDGSSTPLVREIDRAANTETVEEGALHRVVLRVRETPGTINVFAGAGEATIHQPPAVPVRSEIIPAAPGHELSFETPTSSSANTPNERPREAETDFVVQPAASVDVNESVYRSGSYQDWPAILAVVGDLIGAIERGVNAADGNFASIFNAVRLELADDYVFLDPISQTLRYAGGVASLKTEPPVNVFVAGLSEALRRTVNRVAIGERARRIRERIALELLPVARKHPDVLERSGLRAQLDSIVGTTVM